MKYDKKLRDLLILQYNFIVDKKMFITKQELEGGFVVNIYENGEKVKVGDVVLSMFEEREVTADNMACDESDEGEMEFVKYMKDMWGDDPFLIDRTILIHPEEIDKYSNEYEFVAGDFNDILVRKKEKI
jgi:hypothetical protein